MAGKPPLELAGQVFGRLTAVERVGKNRLGFLWKCRCVCGKEATVVAAALRAGATRSCGCLKVESDTAARARAGRANAARWQAFHDGAGPMPHLPKRKRGAA